MSDNELGKFAANELEDEFSAYLEEAKQSPVFRAEYEDTDDRQRLIDSLVMLRKVLGLSQSEVARRMGIGQPTVSGFEKESSDPKLSTLQRYARAVEARLLIKLDMPAFCDWVSPGLSAYNRRERLQLKKPTVNNKGALARAWTKSSASHTQDDYGRVA